MIDRRIRAKARSRRYKRAMLRAIDAAADRPDPSPYINSCSRAAGLRVIREFERINQAAFDPFDELHVLTVKGMGRFSEALRCLRRRGR